MSGVALPGSFVRTAACLAWIVGTTFSAVATCCATPTAAANPTHECCDSQYKTHLSDNTACHCPDLTADVEKRSTVSKTFSFPVGVFTFVAALELRQIERQVAVPSGFPHPKILDLSSGSSRSPPAQPTMA